MFCININSNSTWSSKNIEVVIELKSSHFSHKSWSRQNKIYQNIFHVDSKWKKKKLVFIKFHFLMKMKTKVFVYSTNVECVVWHGIYWYEIASLTVVTAAFLLHTQLLVDLWCDVLWTDADSKHKNDDDDGFCRSIKCYINSIDFVRMFVWRF